MSKADEMFEKISYSKYEDLSKIHYFNKNNEKIIINKNTKEFYKESFKFEDYISMQELQAINKKCEELGWIK